MTTDLWASREPDLIARTQQGDQAAFGELVQHYHRLLFSIASRLGVASDLAEDVAQETFLRAWQQAPRFQQRGEGSFKGWLCRICHNLAIDALRRGRPHVDVETEPLVAGESSNPVARYLRSEGRDRVQAAVEALPPASRVVLILREFEGLSYAEIAQTLDLPPGTVMSRLHYARTALRKTLAEAGMVGVAL